MKLENRLRLVEGLIPAVLFCAANLRGLVIRDLFPAQGAALEAATEFVLLMIVVWLLWKRALLEAYASIWLSNGALILFAGTAAASLFWSIDLTATLLRVLILIFSSMLAAYLAVRYALGDILNIVADFFAVIVVFCFAFVLVLPDAGLMNFYPYYGSWRGIFWHRNYLGSTMALGMLVFLLAFCLSFSRQVKRAIFYGIFFLLALALVVLSKSTTGLILVFVLHIIFVVVILWLKWRSKLRAVHYWAFGGLLIVALAAAYFKLDFLLGLFNRNSTFTGRVGLWSYLFEHVVSQRPFLGYGFGTLWVQKSFQLGLRDALGWPYPIVIGDNGFIDIILHVGIIGFIVFVFMLALACVRMMRLALCERTLLAFVPLLVMAYVLITNFTLSYFLETESFTWVVMVAFLFAATPVGTKLES